MLAPTKLLADGRLKAFQRIFSRFEKLDVMFIDFIHFVLIVEALREGLRLC